MKAKQNTKAPAGKPVEFQIAYFKASRPLKWFKSPTGADALQDNMGRLVNIPLTLDDPFTREEYFLLKAPDEHNRALNRWEELFAEFPAHSPAALIAQLRTGVGRKVMAKRIEYETRKAVEREAQRIQVVELGAMHPEDAIKVCTQFGAEHHRFQASCLELAGFARGRIDTGEAVGLLERVESRLKALKGVLIKAACLAVVCLALSGCAGDSRNEQVESVSNAPANGCAGGHCRAR